VVAIRDGKMATETVRQTSATAASNGNGEPGEEVEEVEEVFEELIVLDSAGRLQVPKDYLEQFNINRRVKLEVIEDGILIKPVSEADRRRHTEDTSAIAEMMEASKSKGLRGLLTRFRRGKKT
jgi:bifunctional DNA-binding transcriptional regulator/antitoxin component of YhaV-PrlF toxin-antitoxin module